MTQKHTNALIHESSPYLLQHAHNPVHWYPWRQNVLQYAQKENKLLLVSIGYAACHWCHVMEHECFEDEDVAEVMNRNFINIKIDREERPDIDHVYMDALQMITGSGGWPLNIIALPDGRPFWGATFVKKVPWVQALEQLSTLYRTEPEKVITYATQLSEGIKSINLIPKAKDTTLCTLSQLGHAVQKWAQTFDNQMGGYLCAPKFMMPNHLEFLLFYATQNKDEAIMSYVNTTLTAMAYGGIYDQIGGGFARYAVDTKWHVPHFEKMLYDNGQLISLYAKAYAVTKNQWYKQVVEETITFCCRELHSAENAFFSSLDADSLTPEGDLEEGAYYVWTENELKVLLTDRFPIFRDYYNINDYGHWEQGRYVLIRKTSNQELAQKHGISVAHLTEIIDDCKQDLLMVRAKRNAPRRDDKIITSWNALMLNGLIDAYRYVGHETFLKLALNLAHFIAENLTKKDGSLYRTYKNGKASLNAYLEDYAALIAAYINLYQVVFDEKWLFKAKALHAYCLTYFYDSESGLFSFTSSEDDFFIRKTIETYDNVIPSSNSIMAQNSFLLSRFFSDVQYDQVCQKMAVTMQKEYLANPQSYAHWLHLVLYYKLPFYEIGMVGEDYLKKAREISSHYVPNAILAATKQDSRIPLLQQRYVKDKTLYYCCVGGACQLPDTESSSILKIVSP
ncbi:thioredoxin domain-containing protein [Arenibacter sp. GZD96]|uniref:thioredoxin domain-containing protein n=1 Tax=Aurantibrevibacter litoralis TaxID=3106030 RepID=UPI002AFEFE10|nr:thioredoxin domain-containing protein [Arenibacter sp. GZD-96]MEA1784609.1 thioredoxin domain-containing protein [Arenibacter sp. GZD-96]